MSVYDVVDIGSAEPPLPPSLTIEDGSVLEGDRGTTRLALTVWLSRTASDAITVTYQTANGTASAKQDYTSTSGTLTFQPDQTQVTISIPIRGDRKREPDETLTVELFNAVGASVVDAVARGTLLNDD